MKNQMIKNEECNKNIQIDVKKQALQRDFLRYCNLRTNYLLNCTILNYTTLNYIILNYTMLNFVSLILCLQ